MAGLRARPNSSSIGQIDSSMAAATTLDPDGCDGKQPREAGVSDFGIHSRSQFGVPCPFVGEPELWLAVSHLFELGRL
jgi:hypothetical protein